MILLKGSIVKIDIKNLVEKYKYDKAIVST